MMTANCEPAAQHPGDLDFRLLLPRLNYGCKRGSHRRGDVGEFDDVEASFAGFVFAYEGLRNSEPLGYLDLGEARLFAHLP